MIVNPAAYWRSVLLLCELAAHGRSHDCDMSSYPAQWLACSVAGVLSGRRTQWPACSVAGVLSGWRAQWLACSVAGVLSGRRAQCWMLPKWIEQSLAVELDA